MPELAVQIEVPFQKFQWITANFPVFPRLSGNISLEQGSPKLWLVGSNRGPETTDS